MECNYLFSNQCQKCPYVEECLRKIKTSGLYKECEEAHLHLNKEEFNKRNKRERINFYGSN